MSDRPLSQWARDHLWFPFSRPGEINGEPIPTLLTEGSGSWITRSNGDRLLDGVGGMEAMAVGHGQQRLIDAATRQLSKLSFIDTFRYASEPAIELGHRLAEIAPPTLNRVHLTPGGSESVEAAIKLAIQYHYLRGECDRRKVVTRHGAFHGVTFGAMNCDGNYHSTRNDIYLGEHRFGVVAEPTTSMTGWGPGSEYSSGATEIRAAVERTGPNKIAAIIVDGASTASGVAVPPPEDLHAIRELCDEYGILMILDEVITGFCRTGSWFISTKYDIVPDLMPISKAMSSGYIPIGGTMVSDRVVETFVNGSPADNVFAHGQTFGAHPVACAVAIENLNLMEEENYADRAEDMGKALRSTLRSLQHHETFVDIRGIGMVNGLEIQRLPDSKRFATNKDAVNWLRVYLREHGLILITIHPGNVFLVTPPIIASQPEFDRMAEVLDIGLSALDAM